MSSDFGLYDIQLDFFSTANETVCMRAKYRIIGGFISPRFTGEWRSDPEENPIDPGTIDTCYASRNLHYVTDNTTGDWSGTSLTVRPHVGPVST